MDMDMSLNIEHIKRNYNISKLTSVSLDEPLCSIFKYLDSVLLNLNMYKSDIKSFKSDVFYGTSENDLYIKYNRISETISISKKIVKHLEYEYGLFKSDINTICTAYLNVALDIKGDMYHISTNPLLDSNLFQSSLSTISD